MEFIDIVAIVLVMELIRFLATEILRNFNHNRPLALSKANTIGSAVRVGVMSATMGHALPMIRWILMSIFLLSMTILYQYISAQNKVKNKENEKQYQLIHLELQVWKKRILMSAVIIYSAFIVNDVFFRI